MEAMVSYIAGLQQPDGSFTGDKWGEEQSDTCPNLYVSCDRLQYCPDAEVEIRAGTCRHM